jgi:hypothetical protein
MTTPLEQAVAAVFSGMQVHLDEIARTVARDPGFTISSRMSKFRDAAFQKKYYGSLQAVGLPE